MIKVKLRMHDGRNGILLGLSQLNIDHLIEGKPIFIDVKEFQADGPLGAVSIFFGQDETAMLRVSAWTTRTGGRSAPRPLPPPRPPLAPPPIPCCAGWAWPMPGRCSRGYRPRSSRVRSN